MSGKWIKNTGVCPVEGGTDVEVYLQNSSKNSAKARLFRWGLEDSHDDIIYYRETANLSLDDAYDEPPKEYFKRPESKYSVPAESFKKSAEAIVAEHFNANYQTNLNEVHIRMISVALQSLKDMEK